MAESGLLTKTDGRLVRCSDGRLRTCRVAWASRVAMWVKVPPVKYTRIYFGTSRSYDMMTQCGSGQVLEESYLESMRIGGGRVCTHPITWTDDDIWDAFQSPGWSVWRVLPSEGIRYLSEAGQGACADILWGAPAGNDFLCWIDDCTDSQLCDYRMMYDARYFWGKRPCCAPYQLDQLWGTTTEIDWYMPPFAYQYSGTPPPLTRDIVLGLGRLRFTLIRASFLLRDTTFTRQQWISLTPPQMENILNQQRPPLTITAEGYIQTSAVGPYDLFSITVIRAEHTGQYSYDWSPANRAWIMTAQLANRTVRWGFVLDGNCQNYGVNGTEVQNYNELWFGGNVSTLEWQPL